MNSSSRWLFILAPFLLVIGCAKKDEEKPQAAVPSAEAKIQAALAGLNPTDRKLAEAQRFCAVQKTHLLGSMDTPVKVMVNGQPVFLCCDGCETKALEDPEKTLATVRELKAKNGQAITQ